MLLAPPLPCQSTAEAHRVQVSRRVRSLPCTLLGDLPAAPAAACWRLSLFDYAWCWAISVLIINYSLWLGLGNELTWRRNGAFILLTSTIVYNDYPRATIICSRERLSTTIIMHRDPDTPTRTHQHAWPRTLPHASTPRSHTHEHVLGRSHLDVLPLAHAQTFALKTVVHNHAPTDTQIAANAATKQERSTSSRRRFSDKELYFRSSRCRLVHVRHGLRHGPYIDAGFVSRAVTPRNGADPGCRRQTLRKGGRS